MVLLHCLGWPKIGYRGFELTILVPQSLKCLDYRCLHCAQLKIILTSRNSYKQQITNISEEMFEECSSNADVLKDEPLVKILIPFVIKGGSSLFSM